jgi:DNA-binding CsgD family transcriptional regulator
MECPAGRVVTAPARPQLTARQARALLLVSEGYDQKAVGRELGVSRRGAGILVERAAQKLGAASIPHAVRLACLAGIIDGRPQRHGDHAGYAAHVRRGEDPKACPIGCWEGELAYRADRRQAKRGQEAASAPASRPEARQT